MSSKRARKAYNRVRGQVMCCSQGTSSKRARKAAFGLGVFLHLLVLFPKFTRVDKKKEGHVLTRSRSVTGSDSSNAGKKNRPVARRAAGYARFEVQE
ncbi:MAG: hypothetical protein ACOX3P_05570 [Saccharofermentanales bacterium]|jgi:hypothetical protein|nr:hypothetical protein [Bacillota bacterium]